MESQAKPNLYGASARVSVQLVFALFRRYGLSVPVWWYILVRLWVKLFVSQGLIQAAMAVSRKASTWSYKYGNKMKIKLE